MPSIEVPAHYGAVILCNVVAPAMLSMFVLAGKVMSARKEFGVAYPNLYGVPGVHKQADEFNKIQRGHPNMFESAIFYLPLSLVAGLEHCRGLRRPLLLRRLLRAKRATPRRPTEGTKASARSSTSGSSPASALPSRCRSR